VQSRLPLTQRASYGIGAAVLAAVLWFVSRRLITFRLANPAATMAVGVAVFLLWIAPDLLLPGYRSHWLFQNAITGAAKGTLAIGARNDIWLLLFRSLRAALIIPIAEELFWRAWLMRWLIDHAFWTVPIGAYNRAAFWATAVLFASEHGPYWDVGFLAGILYNWWIIRTKSLGDAILAHAVTNACLSVYVILAQKWEYWL